LKPDSPVTIPVIDVGALFAPKSAERDAIDGAILQAAGAAGFLSIVGLPASVPLGRQARADLLRIFSLDDAALRKLWRRKFAPQNSNVYRGWFPVQPGNLTSKEGIDMGGDVAYGADIVDPSDPLREATPLPADANLPGWSRTVAVYYRAMDGVCAVLMRSIARGFGLAEHYFDAAFDRGLSTLRLLRYPVRSAQELAQCADPDVWLAHDGERRHVVGAAHTDSGFVTLLAQDEVTGLQARARDGSWVDIAPHDGALVVNFGQVLELWSAGRIKATEHRVVGSGRQRHSIPFFYEARVDAAIKPLPMDDPRSFEPFLFGNYLWARITSFVEFRGMEALRKPTGRATAPPSASELGTDD
jgi:isopenicillin N synthase-like dioxygenase